MSSYLRLGNPQDPEAANSSAEPSDEADAEPLDDIRDAQIDPFSYRPQFTRWDYLKILFNALWLFPLRLIFIVFPSVVIGTILTTVSCACEKYDETNPRPQTGWRKFILQRVLSKVARVYLFGFGFHWIHYKGTPADRAEAPIMLVAPHSSFFDMLIIATKHIPSYVSRAENRTIPIFGRLLNLALRTIWVIREDKNSRQRTNDEINHRAKSNADWPKVLVFPEATTTNRKVLLKFKHGAFTPNVPIQPILLRYDNRLNTMIWGDNGMGLITGFFYTLCQFHNSLEMEFLPVYRPTMEEKGNTALFAENVRQMIGKSLNMRTSNHSIEDLLLMRTAKKLGLPFQSGMVIYAQAIVDLNMKLNEMKQWLMRFSAMDRDKDGYISVEDMARYLKVPNDACLQGVFNALEPSVDNGLSFLGYLYGLVNLSRPLLENKDFLQSVFQFFDQDNDGIVTQSDLSSRLPVYSLPTFTKKVKCRRRRRYHRDANADDSNSIPTEMTFDQFKSVLASNREYLILFHECQNAGITSPPNNEFETVRHDNEVVT